MQKAVQYFFQYGDIKVKSKIIAVSALLASFCAMASGTFELEPVWGPNPMEGYYFGVSGNLGSYESYDISADGGALFLDDFNYRKEFFVPDSQGGQKSTYSDGSVDKRIFFLGVSAHTEILHGINGKIGFGLADETSKFSCQNFTQDSDNFCASDYQNTSSPYIKIGLLYSFDNGFSLGAQDFIILYTDEFSQNDFQNYAGAIFSYDF